jgi:Tfp pilus assembly protein PilV
MRVNKKKTTLSAFSIIEVLIGIFIFSLGLVSIYALLASSLRINDYNSNAIIASNLAREQVELFRNIRDTNYKKLQVWNQINPQT